MQIQVNGKNVDVGEALRGHIETTLEGAVGKYFDRPVDAHVTLSRVAHEFRVDCQVHLATGMTLQSHGQAGEAHPAFEAAVDRLEKRLRRYKRRLKNHHAQRRETLPALEAPSFVIEAESEHHEEPEDLNPVIIAETRTPVLSLTVGEAVMNLDLQEAPVLLFRNSAHGGLNIVYRRADGNIGWIDPDQAGD